MVENNGDSKFYATTRHDSIVLDTEGQGANPVDTLLASLCGCLGHQIRDFMEEQKLISTGFELKAVAGLTEDESRLSQINVDIDMKTTTLNEQQGKELVEFIKRCKIHKALNESVGVVISLDSQI